MSNPSAQIASDVSLEADWPLAGRVGALMTCRAGGLSQAPFSSNNLSIYSGDERAPSNRARLAAELGLPGEPLWLRQVHGVDCFSAAKLAPESEADAVWTQTPGQVLSVQSADCLPVLFANTRGTVVAAAHAGWRGLLGGVLENTLSALPCASADVCCWLGASIGPCCFEVGDEVRAAFVELNSEDSSAFVSAGDGKWLADLYQLARNRLRARGVYGVFGGGHCTACESQRFFSYRRDAGVTGRMASLIWIPQETGGI